MIRMQTEIAMTVLNPVAGAIDRFHGSFVVVEGDADLSSEIGQAIEVEAALLVRQRIASDYENAVNVERAGMASSEEDVADELG